MATYKLVTVKSGKKITLTYRNFEVATNAIYALGGKLYQGKKLVGEL